MSDIETNLGGEKRAFPETQWSRILDARTRTPHHRTEALEHLAQLYWKPVYAYIRSSWAKTNEDAKDLTQEFFSWMLETDFLIKAEPGRGRFRGFLKTALSNFLSNENLRQQRIKRGGGRKILPLLTPDDAPWELPDPDAVPPEQRMDEAWKGWILAQSMTRLEKEFTGTPRALYFRLFRDFYLADESPDYASLARKHGISEVDLSNHLRAARKRFLAILTEQVSDTVQTAEELRDELKTLFNLTLP